jgi:hypothetical protein
MARIILIDRKDAFEFELEKIKEPFFIFNSDTFPFEMEEQLEKLLENGFDVLYVIGRNLYETIKEITNSSEKKFKFTIVLREGIKFRSKWKWGVIYHSGGEVK